MDRLQEAIWTTNEEITAQLQVCPWIFLPIAFDAEACLSEALRLLDHFVEHRPGDQVSHGGGKWKSLALRGANGSPINTECAENYGSLAGSYKTTEIATLCPNTMRFLGEITDVEACSRIRFMLLEPGAEILVHSDDPEKDCSIATNIALNMPDGCEFWTDLNKDGSLNQYSKKIPITDGSAFLFNSAIYHRVVNRSNTPRVHIILHGPLRFSKKTVTECARRQNKTTEYREVAANLLIKKALLGHKNIERTSYFSDLLNLGITKNFLSDDIALGLPIQEIDDSLLQEEALQISAASFSPASPEAFPSNQLDAWLQTQIKKKKEFAVVSSAGTYIPACIDFILEIYCQIGRMKRSGATITGHLIKREGELPSLHEQFLIIYLKNWEKLGSPALALLPPQLTSWFPGYELSAESVRDSHTPLWIERNIKKDSEHGQPGFGTLALARVIESGERVHSLPGSVMELKDYIYPSAGRGENYRRVCSEIEASIKESNERVYVYDTERLKVRDYNIVPSLIISPCAGLKPFSIFKQLVPEGKDARVLFAEKNKAALRYYEALFNCKEYDEVLLVQEQALSNQGLLPKNSPKYVKTKMSGVLAEGFDGSRREFMRCLSAVASAATLVELDFHRDQEKLISYITKEEHTFFWHSNAWRSNHAMYRSSLAKLRSNYQAIVAKVCEKLELPAWIENDGLEAIIGKQFSSPRAVFTYGGSTVKPIKMECFQMFSPKPTVLARAPSKSIY